MRAPAVSGVLGFRTIMAAAAVVLALMIILSSSFWLARRPDRGPMFVLPIPAQVAAIVELVDQTPPETRDLVLRAVNAGSYRVHIASHVDSDETRGGVAFQAFRRTVERYTDVLDGRRVIGMVGHVRRTRFAAPVEDERGLAADYPMRLAVELRPGEFLVIETPNMLDIRLRRTPIGLLVGSVAFLVMVLAVWAIWTEMRPIGDMARSARAFSDLGRPAPVRPGGAREMRRLVDEFNRMQSRISRLMANRTLMMSGMSHDVRTYLTRLRLRVEKMERSDRDAAVRAIDAIQGLLDDTLAFAEAESGEAALDDVDIGALLADIRQSGVAPEGAVSLSGDCTGVVRGHRGRLERAFVNIITNAVKYAGAVEISCRRRNGELAVSFGDRGPGIPDAEKAKVFEPFYRLDAARNLNAPGSGLGLAIAKTIMNRHGGMLELTDREGGGLVVECRFPLDPHGSDRG